MGLAAGGAGRSVVALRPHGSVSSATNAADLGCGSSGLVRIPTRGLRGWGKGRILAVEGSRMYVKAAAEGGRDGGEAVLQKKADCVNGLPKMSNVGNSSNILWHKCSVEKADREQMLRQKGCVIWVTGLSGSGKSTLACALAQGLHARGKLTYILDGDNVRHGLNSDLGFKAEDRAENIRRMGEVAKLFADAGVICIASLISPYRKDRDTCRSLLNEGEFIEVFMDAPLSLCESRDPKGLYKLARAGKIQGFTGIDDPYEPPLSCEIVLEQKDVNCASPATLASQVISYLEEKGYLNAS